MAKVKGLGISKKDIIQMAKATALSYLVTPKKKNEQTPKQRADEAKAKKIHELASSVGGCQIPPLLKLLDELTGLPVSKVKSVDNVGHFDPSTNWCEAHPGALLTRKDGVKHSLCLGTGQDSLAKTRTARLFLDQYGDRYRAASKDEINAFFTDFPNDKIHHLVSYLLDL